MKLVEHVKTVVNDELDRLADQIQDEIKARIPVRTGKTRESIKIEKIDNETRFIGSDYEGLYYYDQGNTGTSKPVAFVPMKNKAVAWDYSKRPYRPKNNVVYSPHGRKGYSANHVIRDVADLHR